VTPERKAGRDAVVTYAIVAVLVTGLVRINLTMPWVGHLGSALVSVMAEAGASGDLETRVEEYVRWLKS